MQGPRQIAFNDMPEAADRRARTDQRKPGLSSARQHRNYTHDRLRVFDDRAPAIERVEVLSPMLSRELVIRRKHPSIVPAARRYRACLSLRHSVSMRRLPAENISQHAYLAPY